MTPATSTYRSRFARAVFDLLNPIPYGLFVGTLIFDITYAATGNVFWGKGAAWLVTTGLFFAIIPRLINLCHVWLFSRNLVMRVERVDFWLNCSASSRRSLMPSFIAGTLMQWFRRTSFFR